MDTIPMNKALLYLCLYIQDTKRQAISKKLLTEDENIDWYVATRKAYYNLDNKIFNKAGIKQNDWNFEAILSYKLPDNIISTEYNQLSEFSFLGYRSSNNQTTVQTNKFQHLLRIQNSRMKRYKTRKDKIEKQIETLQEENQKMQKPLWLHFLIRPLLREFKRLAPEINWMPEKNLLIFNWREECLVYGRTVNGKTVGLSFTFDNEQLFVDTYKIFNNLPKGSVRVPVESIDQLLQLLHQQINSE